MKTSIYNKICGWLAAAMVLTTTSCKDDLFNFGSELDDEVTVSFTLTSEAAVAMTTRGDEDGATATTPSSDLRHTDISGGSKIDVLIYAVYDKDYNLLEGYSNGTDEDLAKIGFSHGDGQTIKKITGFPVDIKITLKRGQEYTVAFWAQSSATKAYDTSDLRKVEVKYKRVNQDGSPIDDGSNINALNNDEDRDVFCNKVTLEAGKDGLNQNVYLFRPLAQINIGTTGYDYELVTRGQAVKYTYSKIRLNRVARYLDVAKDSIYISTTNDDAYGEKTKAENQDKPKNEQTEAERTAESFAVVDFDYAPIPAYIFTKVPDHPSYTKYDWDYDNKPHEESLTSGNQTINYEDNYNEEIFLRVKNSKSDEATETLEASSNGNPPSDDDGYIGYANFKNYDGRPTETYKYLSMCYVLAASNKDEHEDEDKSGRDLLTNVRFWMADDKGENEIEVFSINNVPVQRNWRTNIVGNLLTETPEITVSMDKNFAGEYNGWYDGTNWKWTGQIADGVYYDGVADEIQISNKNGLIWLQQMVNGKLTVREATFPNGAKVGDRYAYYKDASETTGYVPDDHIDPEKLSDDVLNRIIVATHIKEIESLSNFNIQVGTNNSITWPKNYNFSFYKAKIKLMADIDLEGEEWIPIGFDLSVHDTSAQPKVSTTLDYNKVFKRHGSRRLFCGTFDGNGHTIYNLKNMHFTAKVHNDFLQASPSGNDIRPYETVQWMPAGLFGMIGAGATIRNLKLVNVDLYGYHTAGAIAGIAFSKEEDDDKLTDRTPIPIVIENCTVDGGSIVLSPMLRGDNYNNSDYAEAGKITNDNGYYRILEASRTYARGIYAGGIIGHMVAPKGSSITNCAVRNTTIRAYRRAGGILGSISNSEQTTPKKGFEGTSKDDGKSTNWDDDNWDITIKNNTLSNVLIIADKFQPYHRLYSDKQIKNTTMTDKVWKNGYGWNAGQSAYAGVVVGGFKEDIDIDKYYNEDPSNNKFNVKITEFATTVTADSKERTSTIKDVPLNLMPMLSSWFTDNITLESNFYGTSSAKTVVNTHTSAPWQRNSKTQDETANYTPRDYEYEFPMDLPYDLSIDYKKGAPNAGIYVESVELDGGNAIGDRRSVITPNDVSGENACAMFVTARNIAQFVNENPLTGSTILPADYRFTINEDEKTKATIVKNMVLRGSPYAWAGVLISPNENMSRVELDNVNIYDVYQTVALNSYTGFTNDTWPKTNTQNPAGVDLLFKNSNWRGYTNPGNGWKSVSYQNMVFEAGSPIKTKNSGATDYKTLKVGTTAADGSTTFTDCIFKAPFIIEMENTQGVFTSCQAAAAAPGNADINLAKVKDYPGQCVKIEVTSNVQGEPQVIYSKKDGDTITEYKFDKDGNEIKETTSTN